MIQMEAPGAEPGGWRHDISQLAWERLGVPSDKLEVDDNNEGSGVVAFGSLGQQAESRQVRPT